MTGAYKQDKPNYYNNITINKDNTSSRCGRVGGGAAVYRYSKNPRRCDRGQKLLNP